MSGPKPSRIVAVNGSDQCPFPGFASYDIDRREYFKGRATEAANISRWILAYPFTVITGGSGDGKTSLLHAGVAPLIMAQGYDVAISEPGGQRPVSRIGEDLLARVTPNRADTLELLAWVGKLCGADISLRRAREKLCAMADRKDPWPVQRPLDRLRGGVLRSWLTDVRLPDGLVTDALARMATRKKRPTLDMSAADWTAWLTAQKGVDATLIDPALDRNPAKAEAFVLAQLEAAFERLAKHREKRQQKGHDDLESLGIVLVIDQFEEIYVQYRTDHRVRDGVDGRGTRSHGHRKSLISLIKKIAARREWPIRIVLSMRAEHYADLQATFVDQALLSSSVHLMPLRKDQAKSALDQLAPQNSALSGEWEAFKEKAIDGLAFGDEREFVDATELSALGVWLWGRSFPTAAEPAKALLEQVEGALAIEAKGPIGSLASQHEAIDMLAQMTTATGDGQGRRISLVEDDLLNAAWRNRKLRRELLDHLHARKLVRREERGGRTYVEIQHERMIREFENLRTKWRHSLYSDVGVLLDKLRTLYAAKPYDPVRLTSTEVGMLLKNHERINLPNSVSAWLLRGLLDQPELSAWNEDATAFFKWLAKPLKAGTSVAVEDEGGVAPKDASEAAWMIINCLNYSSGVDAVISKNASYLRGTPQHA